MKNTDEPKRTQLRVLLTDEQRMRLRVIALENEQRFEELVTAALQTSPLTKKAFS